MKVQSVRPNPAILKAPQVQKIARSSSVTSPGLLLLTGPGQPNMYSSERAYRDQRFGQLVKSLCTLGIAALSAAFPKAAKTAEQMLFIVDAGAKTLDVFEDGKIGFGEAVDLAGFGAGAAIRYLDADFQPEIRGPDDGNRALPERPKGWVDSFDSGVGVVAKINGIYQAAIVKPPPESPFFAPKTEFADAAKMVGDFNPLAGACFALLDILCDSTFWGGVTRQSSAQQLGIPNVTASQISQHLIRHRQAASSAQRIIDGGRQ